LALRDSNHQKRAATTLRTFRIPKTLIPTLEAEAEARGISVNAVVTSLISKYENWDRFAERFRFIALTDELIKSMLNHLTDEEIAQIGSTLGARTTEEGMMFWYKEASAESLVTYLRNRCRFANFGNLEYERRGSSHLIALQHGMGRKWSLFIQCSIEGVLKNRLGIVPQFEVSDTMVIVRFTG